MKKIKVSKQTYELVNRAFYLFCGFSLGTGISSYLMDRRIEEINQKIIARSTFIADLFKETTEITNDLTLSGEEREKKLREILSFLDIIAKEKL